MQLEKQSEFRVPSFCHCIFDQPSSSYVGILTLVNISEATLFFHITNTFSHYFQLQESKSCLNPFETYQAKFRIRQINQIFPNKQFIFVSWSKRPTNKFCSIQGSQMQKIALNFDQEIIQMEEIDQILEMQVNEMLKVAENQYNEGNFKPAYNMYEQCFLFFRKKEQCLMGMIRTLIQLQQTQKALNLLDLQIYHRPDSSAQALLMKAQVLQSFILKSKGTQKFQFIRTALHLYELLISKGKNIKKGFSILSQKGKERLLKIKETSQIQETEHHFQNIIEKAIDKFEENQTMKEVYSSKKQFSDELNKILKNQEKDSEETPQYAIDPIQYEIYKEPMITPNGQSYQKEFLTHFFKQHGNKDPHTRTYLDPYRVVQNITLKILVRNNPMLPKWLKYEEDCCKL